MFHLLSNDVVDAKFITPVKRAFGLEELRAGEHILRNGYGWKDGEMTVHKLWIAEIRPSSIDPSCLAVVKTDQQQLVVFTVATHPWFAEYPPHIMPIVPATVISTGPIQLDTEWKDPIDGISIDIGRRTIQPGLYLDGISYNFFVSTSTVQLAIQFSNPHTSELVSIESAFLQVAKMASKKDAKGIIEQYISDWAPYTSRPQV